MKMDKATAIHANILILMIFFLLLKFVLIHFSGIDRIKPRNE